MKNIVFLSLLVGLTACNLTSLRVVEDAPAGGDISGDINLPTVEVSITHPAERYNQSALSTFNVDVAGLTQYNTNFTGSISGSHNYHFDDILNPTRVVQVSTMLNNDESVYFQLILEYEATKLPDNTFNSYAISGGASIQLPNGGMFVELNRVVGHQRFRTGTGQLTDWRNLADNPTTIAWVKFFGNFAWVMTGQVSSSTPSQYIFDQDPHTTSAYTNR